MGIRREVGIVAEQVAGPSQSDVGQRVSIRIQLGQGEGFQDLLGLLESPTSIRKKDGTVQNFDPHSIAAWRIVQPVSSKAGTGKPTSLRIAELESAAEKSWPALSTFERGGWRYRISEGFTFRANSILPIGRPPLGEPQLELSAELEYAVEAFREKGITPAIHVPLPTYLELDNALADAGWSVAVEAHLMIADRVDVPTPPLPDEFTFHCEGSLSDSWLEIQGNSPGVRIMAGYPAHYLSISQGAENIAAARIAVADGWAIISRIFIKEEFRGQGLSRALLGQAAHVSGAEKIALQVDITNSRAISLYSSSGFRVHHNYRFRVTT